MPMGDGYNFTGADPSARTLEDAVRQGPSPELAWSPQVRSDCVYMWERTVMGISVHTAETEMATTPY